MIAIRAKTKSGQIQEFVVEQIIEIDGRPYLAVSGVSELSERLARLEGAVEALFRAVFDEQEPGSGPDEEGE